MVGSGGQRLASLLSKMLPGRSQAAQKHRIMENSKSMEETVETNADETLAPVEPSAADTELATLIAERDQLKNERDDASDRLLRLRAEFDNFRRRTQREQADLFERASMDTAAALLPVIDNFELAMKTDASDSEYAKGVLLIYQSLVDTLKKIGLEPLDTVGKPFDPNMHEALDMVPTTEAEDQTVFDEFRKGYNFRGKLLRPAMVRVAVKPAS